MSNTLSSTPPSAETAVHPTLPGEDTLELDLLRRAVANDWGPRDAYERHWAGELVAGMHRQHLLRAIELKALAATEAESPPSEASIKNFLALARYGARLDRDLGAALRALRVLRNRPDEWIDETRKCTSEPDGRIAAPPRTGKPERHAPTATRMREPERHAPTAARRSEPDAPAQPPLNRHERRRLQALQRQAGRRAA